MSEQWSPEFYEGAIEGLEDEIKAFNKAYERKRLIGYAENVVKKIRR